MAAGDWPSGSYISIRRGYLNQLDQGNARAVDIEYDARLPSGAVIFNGGRASLAPFHFDADGTLTLDSQGLAVLAALAASEGIEVRVATGVMHPDGSFTPSMGWRNVAARFVLTA